MADPLAALRAAGYTVEQAIPATDELPTTVYVVTFGDLYGPRPADPAEPVDVILTYGTEATLAELAAGI